MRDQQVFRPKAREEYDGYHEYGYHPTLSTDHSRHDEPLVSPVPPNSIFSASPLNWASSSPSRTSNSAPMDHRAHRQTKYLPPAFQPPASSSSSSLGHEQRQDDLAPSIPTLNHQNNTNPASSSSPTSSSYPAHPGHPGMYPSPPLFYPVASGPNYYHPPYGPGYHGYVPPPPHRDYSRHYRNEGTNSNNSTARELPSPYDYPHPFAYDCPPAASSSYDQAMMSSYNHHHYQQQQQQHPRASPPPVNSPGTEIIMGPPSNQDVLCGRGAPTHLHVGNQYFRDLVAKYQSLYLASRRADKPQIAMKVVRLINARGGRFLKRVKIERGDLGQFVWKNIGEQRSYEKACQALRENAPELRRRLAAQELASVSSDSHSQPDTGMMPSKGVGKENEFRPKLQG